MHARSLQSSQDSFDCTFVTVTATTVPAALFSMTVTSNGLSPLLCVLYVMEVIMVLLFVFTGHGWFFWEYSPKIIIFGKSLPLHNSKRTNHAKRRQAGWICWEP